MIKPRGERALIKIENESMGGIYIPEGVSRGELPQRKGKVVALPEVGHLKDELNIGDTVMFEPYGVEVEYDGEKLLLLHSDYIMCTIK